MTTVLGRPERGISVPDNVPPQISSSKQQRVLACVICQQRKVRCDRKFPCANCIKSGTQKTCVPATLATRRRRRAFPERELLERLHGYEKLLRQNNIKFEPLSKDLTGDKEPLKERGGYASDDEPAEAAETYGPSPSTTIKSDRVYETKNLWHALKHGSLDRESDSDSLYEEMSEIGVTKVWDDFFGNDDQLLFGLQETAIELSTQHPEPAQIFRLWHIYLENVNPLLKVTHTPSLQGRIVDAVSNVTNISPTLEALMFSIYCTAILSLVAPDVQAMFGSSKEDLLQRFQFGCRQALSNCGVLRCDDRDCLTALYLYLVSISTNTVPRSLSSMLGVAIRIAERMGIHNESDLAKCTVFEAEMGRRLWWSLVLFDNRVGELAGYKSTKLVPTWDCRVPLDVNDSDLRREMKEPPEILGNSTEALFALVRAELGDFVRNTMFYLDFTAPALKPLARDVQIGHIPEGGELVNLEKMIEHKYLKSCDLENPLHFMTMWTARAFLAKYRLWEYLAKYSSLQQTEAQRDTAITHAFNMLECHTKLVTSPLTKGSLWLIYSYFPAPAYFQILQDVRRRPNSDRAQQAWAIMDDHYDAQLHIDDKLKDDNIFFKFFAKVVLQAWETRELAFGQSGESLTPPRFVSTIRNRLSRTAQSIQNENSERLHDISGADEFLTSMPMEFGSQMYSLETQAGYAEMEPGEYPHIPERAPLDTDINYLGWSATDWISMNEPARQARPYPHVVGQTPFDTEMKQFDSSSGLEFGGWPLGR